MLQAKGLITRIIDYAADESIVELMQTYALRVRPDIAADLVRSLKAPRRDLRAMALGRLLLNTCYGVDTERELIFRKLCLPL